MAVAATATVAAVVMREERAAPQTEAAPASVLRLAHVVSSGSGTGGGLVAASTPAIDALAGAALAQNAARARAVGELPTFGQPTISGIQGNGFEQDLRVDPTSNGQGIYTSVPGALSSDDSWIWRSVDGGKTFKWVPGSRNKVGKPVACAGGGDTELAFDNQGRLYFADLTLVNYSTSRSDDKGNTWPCSNTGVPWTGLDRQWYAVDGNPVAGAPAGPRANSIYLVSNEIGQDVPPGTCPGAVLPNQLIIARSPLAGVGAPAGIEFGPPNRIGGHCDELIMGNTDVSPVATTTGEVGQPALTQAKHHVYIAHPNAAATAIRIARCFWVNFGPPVANTSDPSGVRCDDLLVTNLPAGTRTGANFPSLAIDNAGNLYVVWQQTVPGGNTELFYTYSLNEGTTWAAPVEIPTPGLLNNVFTWARAGDDGRVGIMWVGTPAAVGTNTAACSAGPDDVIGPWGVYYTMTANGHDPAGVQFTAPVLASHHPIHKLSMFTLIGAQCGNRALGDFFQMDVGPNGEAHLAYASSAQSYSTHAMYVRQTGGPGLYAGKTVTGDPILLNSATDPAGDGKWQLNGTDDANKTNLDILASSFTKPNPTDCKPSGTACYRIQMTINNLTPTLPPGPDNTINWSTQWFAPSDPACASTDTGCTRGGRHFHVFAESVNGGAIRCYAGEGHVQRVGGGVTRTYPGFLTSAGSTVQEIMGAACAAVTGTNGTITIDVPVSLVSLPAGVAPFNNTRYSVTASTMTLPSSANSVPPTTVPQLGVVAGVEPDLADVARAYNSNDTPTAVALRSFTATRQKNTRIVAVRWRTGSETALAGFHVFRERGNTRVRLTSSLVPASGKAGGGVYVFRDRLPARVERIRYHLQTVGLDGRRTWAGATAALIRPRA